jgi:hypothetical protein
MPQLTFQQEEIEKTSTTGLKVYSSFDTAERRYSGVMAFFIDSFYTGLCNVLDFY